MFDAPLFEMHEVQVVNYKSGANVRPPPLQEGRNPARFAALVN